MLLAAAGLIAAAVVAWVALRGAHALGGPATPQSTARLPPGSSSATTIPAGAAVVVDGGPSRGYEVVHWDGSVSPAAGLPAAMALIDQSPDGSQVVGDIFTSGSRVRSVLDITGRVEGSVDPTSEFRWGDDNRHLCLMSNPTPSAGVRSVLSISALGGPPRPLAVAGTGSGSQGTMHEVLACSVSHQLVVVRDSLLSSSGENIGTQATSVRGFATTDGRLLWTYRVPAPPRFVAVSADGQYAEAETIGTSDRVDIVRLPEGTILGHVDNRIALGFSADNSEVVLATQGRDPANSTVEVRRITDLSVLTSTPGQVMQLMVRPRSADIFVSVSTATAGAGPATVLHRLIIRANGSVVAVGS